MESHDEETVFKTINDQLKKYKIVTFKWLSRILNLHSTLAKKCLKEFLKKEPCGEFIITYTILGRKENGELLLMLTKEAEDQFLKKNIAIVDKYIYSIQLSGSVFDSAMIYNVDKSTYEFQQMSLSSINYHTKIIRKKSRTNEQVDTNSINESNLNPSRANSGYSKIPGSDLEENPISNKITNANNIINTTEPKKEGVMNSQMSMESSDDKIKDEIAKTKTVRKEKVSKVASTNGKNIHSFFKKSTPRHETKNEANNQVENKLDNAIESETYSLMKSEPQNKVHVHKKAATSSKGVKKKKKGKKLKRIVALSDSDSDQDSNNSDSHDIPEAEPEPALALSPPKSSESEACTKIVNGRRLKRKVVEETGLDEKGYFCTNKRVVYETCDSEDETKDEAVVKRIKTDDEIIKTSKVESSNGNKNAGVKRKQASISSFFKRL